MSAPSRPVSARAVSRRPSPAPEAQGRLYIDPTRIPPGVRLLWVREATLGQPDQDNVERNLMNGWSPVTADAFPDLVPPTLPGTTRSDTLVRRGGLILMQRAIERCEEDEDRLRRTNQEILEAVDADRRGDRNFQPTRELHSRTERNGRFEDA
jgi:hypothetical protein